jgi:hypothetical protein
MRRRRIRWGWVSALALVGSFGVALWRFGAGAITRAVWFFVPAALVSLVVTNARRGARTSIWSAITVVAAAYSYSWILTASVRWYFEMLLFAVVGAPLASIANAAYRADGRRAQTRRDVAATQLAHALAQGASDADRYALYLRPFAITDRLAAQSLGTGAETPNEVPVHVDLESLLARVLRKECPLIALGREGEMQEGAGRITLPDKDWQDTISRLADYAAILLIVPSAHIGTLWELAHLAERKLIGRTLFVMPEQPRTTPSGVFYTSEDDRLFDVGIRNYKESAHTYDIAGEWAQAIGAGSKIFMRLPTYSPAGALFTLDPILRRVDRIVPLALSVLGRRVSYLRAALAHLGLSTWREPSGTSFADAYEGAVFGRGRTLEYALVVAADAFLTWGQVVEATDLLRRAASVCRRPRFSIEYVQSVEKYGRDCVEKGDGAGALPYLEVVAQLYKDAFQLEPSATRSAQQMLDKAIFLRSRSDRVDPDQVG